MRGDARLVDHSDAVEHAESDATTGRLVATAAEYARWELVVERLLALGADPTLRDDVFHATPRQ